jgi:riboflavin biosynthesis pyrimidine reductase
MTKYGITKRSGGDMIASFLDAGAIDEFIVSIVPVFIVGVRRHHSSRWATNSWRPNSFCLPRIGDLDIPSLCRHATRHT